MQNLLESILGFGALAAVYATPVTFSDVWNPSEDVRIVDGGAVYTFTHNINDNGFNSATDLITSADIDISLRDDESDHWFFGATETVRIRLDVLAEHTAPVAAVPEPGSMALMGLGMLGLGVAARRKIKA